MPEVVGAELSVEAFFGAAERAHHDAGIIDEPIDLREAGGDVVGTFANAVQVEQVKLREFDIGVRHGFADSICGGFALGAVTHDAHNACASLGEYAGRFDT